MALSKNCRLNKKGDIEAVLSSRRFVSIPTITIRYVATKKDITRFAFIVSKKTAKQSVTRNTIRRRASEWVRSHARVIRHGYDVVFVFKTGTTQTTKQEFYNNIATLIKRTPLI